MLFFFQFFNVPSKLVINNQDADADVAVYVDFDATSIFCMLH